MNQTLVQEQFGKNAAGYLTRKPHALGKSLERLVTLTSPQKTWRVLDVATGGGHVAYTFAPHVERMWATDITQEMLDMVKGEAAKARARQYPHHLRQGRGAAVRGWELRSGHLPHRAASLQFDPAIPRRGAPRTQAGRHLRGGGQCGAGRQRRRLRQCLRAFPRSQPFARLDHGRMARRAQGRRLCRRRTRNRFTRQMEFKSWAQRYDDTMKALLRAMLDAGDARGESDAGAERRRRRLDLPPMRGPVHRQKGVTLTQ